MSEPQNGRRRRLLLAAVSGTVLLSGCAPRRPVQEPQRVPTASLQPLSTTASPTVFVTLSSPSRSNEALQQVVNSGLLPALAPVDVEHAYGPVEGVVQLWYGLDPKALAQHGLDTEQGLAVLAEAVGGTVAPVPGRHSLQAWTLRRPDATTLVTADSTHLALPGNPYAPLFALGHTFFTLVPPAWEHQPHITIMLQSRRRIHPTFASDCERLLQQSALDLPIDVQFVMGELIPGRSDASSVHVQLGPFW